MLIRLQKFVIEQRFPLCVKELPMAMGHEGFTRTFPPDMQYCEFLERGWKLIGHNLLELCHG